MDTSSKLRIFRQDGSTSPPLSTFTRRFSRRNTKFVSDASEDSSSSSSYDGDDLSLATSIASPSTNKNNNTICRRIFHSLPNDFPILQNNSAGSADNLFLAARVVYEQRGIACNNDSFHNHNHQTGSTGSGMDQFANANNSNVNTNSANTRY